MKKTRKAFVLCGSISDVSRVTKECNFKGVERLKEDYTLDDVKGFFQKNKSIICGTFKSFLPEDTIKIFLISEDSAKESSSECKIFMNDGNFADQFAAIAEAAGVEIGDHISNQSTKECASESTCIYCLFDKGISNEYKNVKLFDTDYFFVMPTIGQFTPGYLLIIPKRHVCSMAEFNDSELEELPKVIKRVKELLYEVYGCSHVLVWENGTGNGGIGKAKDSIVHAHLHIVPSNVTASDIAKVSGFPFETISYSDIRNYGISSYLLIENEDEKSWIIQESDELYIPRQYIRQIVAEEKGVPGEMWNWRKYPFYDTMMKTWDDIKAKLN